MALVADCGTDERLPDFLHSRRITMVEVVKSHVTLLEQIAQRVGDSQSAHLLLMSLSVDPDARPDAMQIETALPVRTR